MYHCNLIFKDNNTVQLHGYIMYGTKDRCKVVLYRILQYDRNKRPVHDTFIVCIGKDLDMILLLYV